MTFLFSKFKLCAHHQYVSGKHACVSWFASPTPSPSSLSLALRATTAPSAAPRAFTEPTAPRPAPARTTSPARTSTASVSAKKVASVLSPGDLQHSDVSDSDGAHTKKNNNNNNNNSEIKLRYSVEVIAVDMQGFYHRGSSVMLSSYCSLRIPTACVIPTRATRQFYASDIELIPGTFETIWDHFDKWRSIFHAFPYKYTHVFPHNVW